MDKGLNKFKGAALVRFTLIDPLKRLSVKHFRKRAGEYRWDKAFKGMYNKIFSNRSFNFFHTSISQLP